MSATMPHTEKIAQLEARIQKLEAALERITDELGVSDEFYAAPVSNAISIAREALKNDGRTAARA